MELTWQAWLTVGIFASAIVIISCNLLHNTLAMLLGVAILLAAGVATEEVRNAGYLQALPVVSLFIASMVLVRCLEPTRLFEYMAAVLHHRSHGDGRRLLLITFAVTTVLSTVLPNTTVVLFLAPMLLQAARLQGSDPVPFIVFLVLTANTAGLLTLISSVPTFLFGSALRMDFPSYLRLATPLACVALATLPCSAPLLFRRAWRTGGLRDRQTVPTMVINRPGVLLFLLSILGCAAVLFLVGESLPTPIPLLVTAAVASILSLTVTHTSGLDDFSRIIRDIDWETILFFNAMFIIVSCFHATGIFDALGFLLSRMLTGHPILTVITVLCFLAMLSSIMPNIPLMAVMVPAVGSFLVTAGYLTKAQSLAGYTAMPGPALGIQLALLFGISLGGNATVLGAVPNLIAAGICRDEGTPITFAAFSRLGLPATLLQVAVSGVTLLLFFH